MLNGRYEVHEEFQDEDKWFRLTKRQWGIVLPFASLIIGMIYYTATTFPVLLPVALIISIWMAELVYLVAFRDIPDKWYLYGNGIQIEKIIFRYFRKKTKKKQIFTKHHDNGYQEW